MKLFRQHGRFAFLWAVTALLAAPAIYAGELSEEQIADLFSQGKERFREANTLADKDPEAAKDLYNQAAMRFERICREGGIHSGRLYYNIGNAYFLMGDIGHAILYYRRAEPLIPNDPLLRQNLDYARSRRVDKLQEKQETRVLKTLFFWHYDFSTRFRLALFVGFLATFCAAGSVRLFVQRIGVAWLMGVSAALALLMFGSLLAETIAARTQIAGVLVAPEVVARKGDADTYESSFEEPLHAGAEFTLVENRGDWYQIELPDGRRCWIPSGSAGLVTQFDD